MLWRRLYSQVLKEGYRTGDIMSEGCSQVGTAEMGDSDRRESIRRQISVQNHIRKHEALNSKHTFYIQQEELS